MGFKDTTVSAQGARLNMHAYAVDSIDMITRTSVLSKALRIRQSAMKCNPINIDSIASEGSQGEWSLQ